MAEQRILITGAAGNVASSLRPRIARADRILRLLDIREPTPRAESHEESIIGSVTDLDVMTEACEGVSAVVHLGGQGVESTIDTVLDRNVRGTYTTLEAARRADVKRVILASSNHAVGFTSRTGTPIPADTPPRPDTLYGLSKVGMEAAGRLYADRYGMDVLCLRIGSWFGHPGGIRGLATWLSPDDGARLVEACLSTPSPGFRLIWGISRNTRRWFSLSEGEEIGYYPQDDAEVHASEIIAHHGEGDFDSDPELTRVGGNWCGVELGKPM